MPGVKQALAVNKINTKNIGNFFISDNKPQACEFTDLLPLESSKHPPLRHQINVTKVKSAVSNRFEGWHQKLSSQTLAGVFIKK
jgi:hypothetical protein